MKRFNWLGWLLAGLLLLQNAAAGLAAPTALDPLEGHVLQGTDGLLFLYHGGVKFPVQLADMSNQVIEAIPTASSSQWDTLFGNVGTPDPVTPTNSVPAYPAS